MKNFYNSCKAKTALTLCVFLGLFWCTSSAQPTGNPAVDAHSLEVAIENQNKQQILDFINAARPDDKKFTDYDDMITNLDAANPIAKLIVAIDKSNAKNIKPSSLVSSSNAFAQGGAFTNNVINVVSSFIAERFKQELEIAFLDKLKELLNGTSDASKALKALLPTTSNVLSQNEPDQYTTFLETLKEAIKQDVNNFPLNIGVYLKTDPFNFAQAHDFYYPSLIVYTNTLQAIGGRQVVDVLNSVNNDPLMKSGAVNEPYNAIIRLIGVMSRTLTNPDAPSPQWLSIDKIKSMISDPKQIPVFFGLLMIKEEDELKQIVPNGTDLYSTIAALPLDKLTTLVNKIESIDNALTTLYANFKTLFNAINNNTSFSGLQVTNLVSSLSTTFSTLPDFLSVAFNKPFSTTFVSTINTNINSLVQIRTNIADKNYGLALTQIISVLTGFITDDQLKNKLLFVLNKYGNFAVTVATSSSTAEMQAALESAALPVGSYRIKRNAYENLSINAYAGVFGGVQKYSSSVPAGVKSSNSIIGFTAPIGVAYSWSGKTDDGKWKGHSNTIFVSIADLGAVTSYRLTHDSTAPLPAISFKNIIAPAGYYVYGFKKIPLSAGLGVQYGPELRSIRNDSPTILPSAWSVRLFLAVDIPFFNLYSKTEKKKEKQ